MDGALNTPRPAGAPPAAAGAAPPAASRPLPAVTSADPEARIPAVMSSVFLELLAADATAVEFERPLVEARARGEDAAAIAELERAKLLALRIRETLERRRRREAELAALYDTASDLAALRDLDAVLRAIVHRARGLLRTDVAYLSMLDDTGTETYMRVTDGSVSARFQRVRIPLGRGLGGLVAQTGQPYSTANYLPDDRFRHTDEIDGSVADEGLVSILGVPLLLGRRVIGVLYAANRSERPWARDEVALLSSLAAHASVAIDNARLLDETRAALDELNRATGLVRAHSAAVERAAEAHDRLAGLLLRGGGVEDVAAAVTEVLGGTLAILDADGHVLARVGDPRLSPPDPGTLRGALATSRATGRSVPCAGSWIAPAAAGAEQLGVLVLGRDDLDDADQLILERAAMVTALLLLFRRSMAEAESQVRGDLLDDLLAEPMRDADGLIERARLLDVDLTRPHAVVVSRTAAADRRRVAFAAGQVASPRSGLGGEFRGLAVLLLPGLDAGEAARLVARELAAALGNPVTAGAAGPAARPDALVGAYAEARRCMDSLLALGREGAAASVEELGFVGVLLGDGRDVGGFVTATIGPVVAYDERRGTQLVHTLTEYFAHGGNLARTAAALHVHVNTVGQRLSRIEALLGDDWQQPDRSLEVQLALRLYRLGPALS